MKARILTLAVVALVSSTLWAQNPIIRDQFTADPSALVVGDRVYVFPSHDIKAPAEYARTDEVCTTGYHDSSTEKLRHWSEQGKIVV